MPLMLMLAGPRLPLIPTSFVAPYAVEPELRFRLSSWTASPGNLVDKGSSAAINFPSFHAAQAQTLPTLSRVCSRRRDERARTPVYLEAERALDGPAARLVCSAVLHKLKCLVSLSSHLQHLWTTQDARGIKPIDDSAAVALGALANVDKGGRRSYWWVPSYNFYAAVLYGSCWEVPTPYAVGRASPGPGTTVVRRLRKVEVPHLSPWLALRPWLPRRGPSRSGMPPIKADAVVLRPSTAQTLAGGCSTGRPLLLVSSWALGNGDCLGRPSNPPGCPGAPP
ncbi:hypothetical protein TgHK011_009291 [Trichoderma gracile]|nr:hypothetical protein TgHK011_009291 [Trichoderma gracile]